METNHVLDGRTVDVKRAVPREKPSAPTPAAEGGGDKEALETVKVPPDWVSGAAHRRTVSIGSSSSISSVSLDGSSNSDEKDNSDETVEQSASGKASAGISCSGGAVAAPKVSAARAEKVPEQARKIFVGGLASGVSDADFRAYFEQFGAIADAVSARELLTPFRPLGVTGAAFALLTC